MVYRTTRCKRKVQVQLAIVEMRHVTRVPDCPKPSAVSTPAACVLKCLARRLEGLGSGCDWTVCSRLGRPSLAQVPEGRRGILRVVSQF